MRQRSQRAKDIQSGIFHGLFDLLVILTALGWISYLIVGLTGWDVNDCDRSSWHRCGASVITDHKTGLQYLQVGNGLTPRLGLDGEQIRDKASVQ